MIKHAVFIILSFSIIDYPKNFQFNMRLVNMVKIKSQFHVAVTVNIILRYYK